MKNELTFNDLPMIVKELCNKVESLEETLLKQVASQPAPMHESRHTPMTSEEAREYLKMPKSTFYFKVGNGLMRNKFIFIPFFIRIKEMRMSEDILVQS